MLSWFLLFLLMAQSPAKGAIKGTVIAADTGAPIADVSVFARSESPEFLTVSTTTDAQGRFSFADLDPDRTYSILTSNISGQAYAGQAYGAPLPGTVGWPEAVPIALTPGKTVDGIVVRLVRTASTVFYS